MSERSGELRGLCANYAYPSLPTYPSLPEENYSPSTPSERSSTRDTETLDGSTDECIGCDLEQYGTHAEDCPMEPHDAPRPLDSDAGSVPVVRPVVVAGARSAEEIRALCDAATPGPWFVASREGDDEGWWVWADRDEPFTVALLAYDGPDGTTDGERELADAAFTAAARDLVPQLLAEVEAAHRFEQSVAVEREALLREVEQLRDETARLERHRAVWQAHCEDNASVVDGLQTVVDSLRGVVQAARERDRAAFLPVAKAIHDTIGDDRCSHDALGDDCWHIARAAFVALAAAADAPQPSTEDCLSLSCGFGEHDKCPNGCDCDCHFGPSPAVLPEPKEQR